MISNNKLVGLVIYKRPQLCENVLSHCVAHWLRHCLSSREVKGTHRDWNRIIIKFIYAACIIVSWWFLTIDQ